MGKRRKNFRRAQLAKARKNQAVQEPAVPQAAAESEPAVEPVLVEEVVKEVSEDVIEEISIEVFTPTPEISPAPVHANELVEGDLAPNKPEKKVKKTPVRSKRSRYRKAEKE